MSESLPAPEEYEETILLAGVDPVTGGLVIAREARCGCCGERPATALVSIGAGAFFYCAACAEVVRADLAKREREAGR